MILLDVEKIEDKYDEYKKTKDDLCLSSICTEIYNLYKDASSSTLSSISKQIDENINFYRGNHHLYYDETSGRYQEYGTNKFNVGIPQETTNYVGTEVDTIVSLLTRSRETFFVVENSSDADDRNKAKVGEAILEGNYYLNNELSNKIQLVKTLVLCGTVYRKDYWNKSKCVEYGDTTYDGETETKILSPLQIIPDYQNAINDIDDGRYITEFGYHPVSYIKNAFKGNKDGNTGKAKNVKEDTSLNIQLDYLQNLKMPGDEKTKLDKYSILLETYIKPTHRNKQGLMIISTSKEILYIAPNNVYNQFGGKFWSPYSMARFKRDIFSHYGLSLPELIIPLNKSINSIDSLIKLNRATMVSPKTIVPVGSMIQDQSISGMPGEIIYENPGVGQIRFEYGKPLDQSVLTERQQKVSDISKISGVNEILQGIRPAGVSTTSGLNLLTENAYSQFNVIGKEIENCLEKAYTRILNLKRNCYKSPRSDYYKRILATNNSLTKISIKDYFTGGDLGNNIDVRVEQGSTAPKSLVMEQQNIKEIADKGVFGILDPVQNPIGNKYFLSKFGLGKFATPTNNDTTKAFWENDLLRNGKPREVKVMPVDNNVIHFKVLNQEIKKPDFYDNNSEKIVMSYWKHLCEHFQKMEEQQYIAAEITPVQMNDLDIMSVRLGVIGEEELMMKRQPPMPPEGQEAMTGQMPEQQNVPMPEGQMPSDSMIADVGAMQNKNSSEMM